MDSANFTSRLYSTSHFLLVVHQDCITISYRCRDISTRIMLVTTRDLQQSFVLRYSVASVVVCL